MPVSVTLMCTRLALKCHVFYRSQKSQPAETPSLILEGRPSPTLIIVPRGKLPFSIDFRLPLELQTPVFFIVTVFIPFFS